MSRLFFLIVILTLMGGFKLAAQIQIKANNTALESLLRELNQTHKLAVSFDPEQLSGCRVTLQATFELPEQALAAILKQCHLTFKETANVYLIYPQTRAPVSNPKFSFRLHLLNAENREPLPNATLWIQNKRYTTNQSGLLSFFGANATTLVQIAALGYQPLDTLLAANKLHELPLKQRQFHLKEVVLAHALNAPKKHESQAAGFVKLNHQMVAFLLGNNNNTLYNLLHLQPGILGTAEKSGDFNIWGSYHGQNLIRFDEIPLFSSSPLNHQMGIINALMINDVEVFKGGYGAGQEDRVGGLIEMSGKSGNPQKLAAELNLTSQFIGGRLNVPLSKKEVLQAAFRTSFNEGNLFVTPTEDENLFYVPRYTFQDINLKLSRRFAHGGNFYVSFLGNKQRSYFKFRDLAFLNEREWENNVNKQQLGGTIFYSKAWENLGILESSLSYTDYRVELSNGIEHYESNAEEEWSMPTPIKPSDSLTLTEVNPFFFQNTNGIKEFTAKLKHQFPARGQHQIKWGFSLTQNSSSLEIGKVANYFNTAKYQHLQRWKVYFEDKIFVGERSFLLPGFNINYIANSQQWVYQPRLRAHFKWHPNWNLNLAWGLYHQFLMEIIALDALGNYYYYWDLVSNNEAFSISKSRHLLIKVQYEKNNWQLFAEAFHKKTTGLFRSTFDDLNYFYELANGENRAVGVDVKVQKTHPRHDFWVSYSFGKVLEKFEPYNHYRRAPHDQTHEWKGVAILNRHPWFFSCSYIYGSGLYLNALGQNPYNRLDVAIRYDFNFLQGKTSTGLSVTNLLNAKNIGALGISNLPNQNTVFSRGVARTPRVFFKWAF